MEPYILTLSEILVPVTSCLFFFKWGLFYRQHGIVKNVSKIRNY